LFFFPENELGKSFAFITFVVTIHVFFLQYFSVSAFQLFPLRMSCAALGITVTTLKYALE
jgi:hypothetical protein